MSSNLKITIMGCGNSTGVPAIGNYWGKCDPNEPKNRRMRSSILVQSANTTLVVDTGPDFREQMNIQGVQTLDSVLLTHAHSDHVNGIDELRMIRHRTGKLVPIYSNKETFDDLRVRFNYLFEGGRIDVYPPILDAKELHGADFGKTYRIGDIDFIPFEQDHGSCTTVGYRFGDFAYSVDMWTLNEEAIHILKGVKTWLVDGAGYKSPNMVHANLDTIFKLNERIGAQQVYLSSLTLAMDYQTLISELPKGYAPAYDGLVLQSSNTL